MPKPDEWDDQFIRNMIAKGSLTPPPVTKGGLPRWYWPLCIVLTLAGMATAFWWGVYGG